MHLRTLLASLLFTSVAAAGQLKEDEKAAIMEAQSEFGRAHEGRPLGVPNGYDWYSRSVMKQGNHPGTNKALTGWGHAFWAEDSGLDGLELQLQLRDLRVFLCSGSPGRWRLIQRGTIYGRQFDADFRQNISREAAKFQANGDGLTVTFPRGSAFHFWPRMDRHILPDAPLCGIVVTVQAREVRLPGVGSESSGNYLIGLGADYWRDRTAIWDGKDSNPGIAVGRLRYLSEEWRWYALNTSAVEDTMRLLSEGFEAAIPGR